MDASLAWGGLAAGQAAWQRTVEVGVQVEGGQHLGQPGVQVGAAQRQPGRQGVVVAVGGGRRSRRSPG
ncbi:MAG: hypothetical protein R2719_04170 [Micropruina sp.]